MADPTTAAEEERLATLYAFDVLDSAAEQRFDEICQLAAIVCETPMAIISLLDRHRQWFKASVGLDFRETPREHSFCSHTIVGDEMMVVEDAQADARFAAAPLVLAGPGIRFYAGEPLRAYDGHKLGALCVLDVRPRKLTGEQLEALRTLARQVEAQLELRRVNLDLVRVDQVRERLSQFVLHDLSSPVTSIGLAASDLRRRAGDAPALTRLADDIDGAVDTMQALIEDLRDLAVSRAGALAPRWQRVTLDALAEHVRAIAGPKLRERGLRLEIDLASAPEEIEADPHLVRRLLQNLVLNAIDFSPAGGVIRIGAAADGGDHYSLQVDDDGPGIPPERREHIFDLYARDPDEGERLSRGIGLAFCRAAAEAHGGTISVQGRRPKGSSFCARLPVRRVG